ncbi:MAG: chloride channel protein, partial [Halanaerobiales bacterium]
MNKRLKNFSHALIYSTLIGISVGLIAILFNYIVIKSVQYVNQFLHFEILYIILPIIAAILTWGFYTQYLKYNHSGLGVVQVLIELEFIKTFLMKPLSIIVNLMGAIVSLVFGLSVGRFGPIVHLGASVGSNVAYYLNLEEEDIRMLVGCGAAAAITAVFKIPFFATVFVLEVLFKKHFYDLLTPIIIASMSSFIISNYFSNYSIVNVQIPKTIFLNINDYLSLILFGLIAGVISILMIELIERFSSYFNRYQNKLVKYSFAASIVGVISYFIPLNFEIHKNTTFRVLSGEFGLTILIAILLAKLITTGLTLGSGFIGGNFYPGVTIGATIGMIYNSLLDSININLSTNGLYGVLGVGAVIASSFNAPISGIVLILEITKSFDLIIPSILVVAFSVSLVYFLYQKDIFTKQYNKIYEEMQK